MFSVQRKLFHQNIFRGKTPHRIRNYVSSKQSVSSALDKNTVRVGCASGFWGDTAVSAPQLIFKGNIDFLVFDYLSEITMSLLTAAKQKFPNMGYAPDFVQVGIGPYLGAIKQKGIRVISNAGGINPLACAAAIQETAKKAGVDIKVAVVTGDDIMSKKAELEAKNTRDMFSGLSFPSTVTSMTTYLGASGIVRALELDADIVVTGRCTDSALTLAPLIHRFNWSNDDFDRLAAGSLAGHLIECGAQATGGIFTDWHTVPDWHKIGFPIVECFEDGKFILTKPGGTGGLVSPGTVSEQLVYEIGDPTGYLLPDVTCDFSNVKIEAIQDKLGEAVLVSGARGKAPTDTYKVSATYADGYRITAVCIVRGTKASAKGRKTADAILKRVRGIYKLMGLDDFTDVYVEAIGSEESYGKNATAGDGPRECTMWIAATHKEKKALEILAREIAPAGTGMAPGLSGIVGGRPKVSPVLKLFSFLYPKKELQISVHANDKTEEVPCSNYTIDRLASERSASNETTKVEDVIERGAFSFRLEDLAFARSGDKGNHCNIVFDIISYDIKTPNFTKPHTFLTPISVVARHPSFVPYIRKFLTPEAVYNYMYRVFDGKESQIDKNVARYELPGINGFNFVLYNSLGGGGIASLRSDPQGKAFAQMLLDFRIENVPNLLAAAQEGH